MHPYNVSYLLLKGNCNQREWDYCGYWDLEYKDAVPKRRIPNKSVFKIAGKDFCLGNSFFITMVKL